MARQKDTLPESPIRDLAPDGIAVTKPRAEYLARLTGVPVKDLVGRKASALPDLLKWTVDPQLLLFRRVCGRVVKQNPVTGGYCPVPNATVHVLDTDCTFLGLFPRESPFFWIWPIRCRTEEIGTVRTDACGRFCVFLPYWDIDRILRFRRQRICFPDIFRLRIRDLIELLPDPPILRDPRPLPDPPPLPRANPAVLQTMRALLPREVLERLQTESAVPGFGEPTAPYEALLDAPVPTLPPPLPEGAGGNAALQQLAATIGLDTKAVGTLSPRRFRGPYLRCRDVWVAEWVTFLDVPDISFRVTQDVDGDGTEEVIYTEGPFDVRWNAPSNLTVTLEAAASAICVPMCDPIAPIPCGNQPAISTAGYMPLEPTHHDDATGLGKRVNRPVASGAYPPGGSQVDENATAPYAGTLNLHGCHRIGDATHYRLTHRVNGLGAYVPFTGLGWWAPKNVGAPVHVLPDAMGWYPILNPAADYAHPQWLLSWPTTAFSDGTYEVKLELGKVSGGGIAVVNASPVRRFEVDNTRPVFTQFQLAWRYASGGSWQALPAVCPVIVRDPTRAIRIQVSWSASADYLRNAECTASGCGGGNPLLVQPTPASPDVELYREWHKDAFNNAVTQVNEFEITPGMQAGCYTFRLYAASRAFSPSGFDFGPALNWLVNQVFWWSDTYRSVSVVDQ